MTPVESTTTCSASSPRRRAVSAAVASASSSPRTPVAAFATPELMTTACGSASSRWRRERSTGAACMRFAVNIAVPVAGSVERTSARSGAFLRMPQWTPEATKPRGEVTLTGPPPAGRAASYEDALQA
jgi:hypothetical protein